MSIRLPLKVVLSSVNNDEVGAGSALGVLAIPFQIPQDTDNITVKFSATTAGGAVSAQLQTTDDGGNTWYGVARTSVVSAATGDAAEWLSVPVISQGFRSASIVATGSVLTGFATGNAAPSTLSSRSFSGLPILSQQARIAIQITGNLTSSSILTEVKVNSQSATA